MINEALVEERNVRGNSVERIKEIHEQLDVIFKNIDTYVENIGYKAVAELVTDLDYQLQDNWGYARDKSWHTYWYKIPGCTCPKMDNAETRGVGRDWINMHCPFHGVE